MQGEKMKTENKIKSREEAIATMADVLNKALSAGGDTVGYGEGMIELRQVGIHPMVSDLQQGAEVSWEPASKKMQELRASKYGKFLGYIKIVYPFELTSRMCPVRKDPTEVK